MTDLVPARALEPDRVRELVDTWLRTRRSDNTRDAYRRDLALWLDWCHRHGLDPLDVWPGHVQLWLADLHIAGESGSTRDRRLAAVSSCYDWMVRHQAAPRNPARLAKDERPVRAPRKTPALSDDHVARLLAAADRDPNPRAAAIVYLLLMTGIRVGELVAADVDDVGLDRGLPVLDVNGKGGKLRTVGLVPDAFRRLDAYLSTRDDVAPRGEVVHVGQAGARPIRPLIATARGRRIDRKEVRRVLRRLAVAAGLPDVVVERMTPHTTRGTYITAALDDGAPVRDVQYAAGHQSPVTTEGYDRSALSPERNPGFRLASRWMRRAGNDAQPPGTVSA